MLQFWRKDKQKSPNTSPKRNFNGNLPGSLIDSDSAASVGPLSHFNYDVQHSQPCEIKSRLSLNLEDVFQNQIALSYFSQYMEAHGYGNIFNLLMDIENVPFKLANVPSRRNLSLNSSPSKTPPASASSDVSFKSKSFTEPSVSLRKIYSQYIVEDAPSRVRLPEELRLEIQTLCASDNSDLGIENLREHIHQLIKKDVWLDFLRSDWFCKYQIEIMTSGKMTLSDILYNDACLASFVEFLQQEGCECVIEFWLTAMNFYRQYSSAKESPNSTQIQDDAILIYDKFLSLQATTPLGVNDRVRFAVEEGICGETETGADCLMPAVCLVEAYLRSSQLRLFLSSDHYLCLLSEVMSASRPGGGGGAGGAPPGGHSSPASSVTEGSHLTEPPLSAASAFGQSRISEASDLLWRRRKHMSGLSFGRVDELGRYETDIEPEPDKKSESRISRVVKLILNRDEQKSQEEMAWRVAEMIVKDITSITLGGDTGDEL